MVALKTALIVVKATGVFDLGFCLVLFWLFF